MKRVGIYCILTAMVIAFVAITSCVYGIDVTISDGTPGPTSKITASDTATSISTSLLTVNGVAIKGAIISVDTYPLRVALGGTTPTTTTGHLITAGGSMRLYGYNAVQYMKYINATSGSNAVIQFTPLY